MNIPSLPPGSAPLILVIVVGDNHRLPYADNYVSAVAQGDLPPEDMWLRHKTDAAYAQHRMISEVNTFR
ncbi:hypothetical protein [Klebsiella aerogenes]|uniref:hypothetical protein n=1 Tax=Klebsiella aerogenes TaxID=548 RepID=UPI001F459591|nr:hypothetical protein [Klebsiella aerogenes]